MRLKRWRVRVKRVIEDWIEVQAADKGIAEQQASLMPGVHAVLPGYTMSGEKPLLGERLPNTVEDPDE